MVFARTVIRPGPTLPASLAAALSRRVAEVTARPARVGPPFAASTEAYDASRRQYRGEEILRQVCAEKAGGREDVVALVDEDCYGAGLNFVFGQASLRGGCAFVALPRLRAAPGGGRAGEALFRLRVVKEIVHELGHTWGQPHCPDPHCIMHFSNTLADTDRKGPSFCPACRRKLG